MKIDFRLPGGAPDARGQRRSRGAVQTEYQETTIPLPMCFPLPGGSRAPGAREQGRLRGTMQRVPGNCRILIDLLLASRRKRSSWCVRAAPMLRCRQPAMAHRRTGPPAAWRQQLQQQASSRQQELVQRQRPSLWRRMAGLQQSRSQIRRPRTTLRSPAQCRTQQHD